MIKYANVFDMCFVVHVLHNFTFHDNFARFFYVHGLSRDVEEIMQITCPALHCHPMSSDFESVENLASHTFVLLNVRLCLHIHK